MPGHATRRNPIELRALALEAAEQVFAERGYAGATSRELARAAGVSESVLYRHFGSKGRLFTEAVLSPFLRFLDTFSDVSARYLSEPLPTETMARLFVSGLIDQLTVHRQALRTFLAASEDIDVPAKTTFQAALNNVFVRLGNVIAVEQGARGKPTRVLGPEMDVRAAVGMFIALVVLDDWMFPPGDDRPSRDQLVDHLTSLLMYQG